MFAVQCTLNGLWACSLESIICVDFIFLLILSVVCTVCRQRDHGDDQEGIFRPPILSSTQTMNHNRHLPLPVIRFYSWIETICQISNPIPKQIILIKGVRSFFSFSLFTGIKNITIITFSTNLV
jgi:hypothetical protein